MNDAAIVGIVFISNFAFFGCIAFVAWQVLKNRQRQIEALSQAQTRMLDRFGSAGEFVEFIKSPEGRQFVQGFSNPMRSAVDRLFGTIRAGLVLSLLGVAFLIIGAFVPAVDMRDNAGFFIAGGLIVAIGIGFLLSAWVAHRMSRVQERLDAATTQS